MKFHEWTPGRKVIGIPADNKPREFMVGVVFSTKEEAEAFVAKNDGIEETWTKQA